MIIYIHGFNSSGFGAKAEVIRRHYQDKILAPSLSNIPLLAIDTLEQIITYSLKYEKNITLIGSSLGGYYAIYLASKYGLKAVLINPSIYPYKTLAAYIGENQSFFDASNREWTQKHIDSLKMYEVLEIEPRNFLVLLQKGDETLDYTQAASKFSDAYLVIDEGGSHGYDDFEKKLPMIEAFESGVLSL
ncbi:MAG: esterase [Epsilonproteobacteria bacterium]|nr:esterase [Campylobacterota bacterium]